MPIGLDLGFSYLGLVVLFVVPVVALVLRRKWQLAVERNEEIRRLLVLAAEEAAGAEAELEVSPFVGSPAPISRPLVYQCALCFSPTRTRCARCKSIRYCSGKCQILHWRQGHKEECRPFTFSNQSEDARGGSSQKVLKQVKYEIDGDSSEIEREQCAKSVKHVAEGPVCVESNFTQKISRGDNRNEVDWCADGKGTYTSSHGAELPDRYQPIDMSHVKLETSCADVMGKNEKLSPKHTTLLGPTDHLSNSGKLHPIEPNFARGNLQVGSMDFLTSVDQCAHESSLFGHSTQEEGFWQETRSSSQPHFNATGDDKKMLNSRSSMFSVNSYGNHNAPRIDVRDSSSAEVQSNGIQSNVKKPIGIVSPTKEMREDVASQKSFPNDSPIWRSEDGEYSSSGVYANQRQSAESPSDASHDSKVSVQCLSSERPDHVDIGKSSAPRSLASKKCVSLSCNDSVAHLSAHSKEQSLLCGKTNFAPTVVARSSDITSYSPNVGNGLKASPVIVADQLKATKSQRHCQSGGGSEISGRYNYKGLFPYDLFVKLYNWSKIELQPCGLTNCGNSCYANSVLQCLACTQPLTAYFLQGLHSKACQRKEWCFTCEFEIVILKAKEGESPLSPMRILSQIQNGGSHLGSGKEEDAHEFLRYAIDRMQSNCLNDARVDTTGSLEEETTLIGLTFGGYLRSKIKCMKCRGKSDRVERMMDLTVEIDGDVRTLEEALHQFTRTETLDGENKYQCSRCRSYERAKKKFTVLEAPNILTIALKRFQSGKFGKLNKSIRFPEILNLAPYMSGTGDKSPIYRLYGVVVHLDIMNAAFSGHYVCYVKNVQNKWFQIDDSRVKAVDLGSVLTKDAYMLFYARCSPRAPRLIRNSILPCDPRRPKHSAFNLRSHPTTGPWNAFHGQAGTELPYPSPTSLHHIRTILEDDSLSDNSSTIFSEGCSSSTESNRDSISTDDCFDPFLGDVGRNWRNSSDSDSSSSSSSPCPLYSRHSPLGEADRYSSEHPETSSGFQIQNTKSHVDDGRGFWHSGTDRNVPFLCSDSSKHCTNLVGRSSVSRISCRDTDSDRLGFANIPVGSNNFGVSLKKSMKERTD